MWVGVKGLKRGVPRSSALSAISRRREVFSCSLLSVSLVQSYWLEAFVKGGEVVVPVREDILPMWCHRVIFVYLYSRYFSAFSGGFIFRAYVYVFCVCTPRGH